MLTVRSEQNHSPNINEKKSSFVYSQELDYKNSVMFSLQNEFKQESKCFRQGEKCRSHFTNNKNTVLSIAENFL